MNPRIEFKSVNKAFRTGREAPVSVLQDVSFRVSDGEFLSLVGPSGCGKSTILNVVAGLTTPDTGVARFDGDEVSGPNTHVGYLTQDDALLPWRSVLGNVALPLEIKGVPRRERQERARALLDMVGLADFTEHRPTQLSGGMRQRVSLARTLVYRPDTLLLDEPFGALDAQTRIIMQKLLLRVVVELNVTVLLVTHDLTEAVSLSDRVFVFSRRPAHLLEEVTLPVVHGADPPERLQGRAGFPDQLWNVLKTEQDTAVLA